MCNATTAVSKLVKDLEYAVVSVVLFTIDNPLSHSITVGQSPDFEPPCVAILSRLCNKRHKTIFTDSLQLYIYHEHLFKKVLFSRIICILRGSTHYCAIAPRE